MDDLCHTLFVGYGAFEPKDREGCLKPAGHFDHHIFEDENGKLIAWDYDEECQCGCWDTVESDSNQCMVFWEVKTIEE